MGLRASKGNMYQGWITHTWNTIKGECPFLCNYCYMNRWGKQQPVRFDEKELRTDLGKDNFIFVGSSCDMFADSIPGEWIADTMLHMAKYDNSYLIQSKNPGRIKEFLPIDAHKYMVCTTIESNRHYRDISKAPSPLQRALDMHEYAKVGIDTLVTIEPVMKFDLDELVRLVKHCGVVQVNIGADSGRNNLPEPSKEEILELIKELEGYTKVVTKSNLKRLLIN